MELEEHARLMGRLVGNLQSLEFALRAYLYAKGDPPHTPFPPGQTLQSLKVGDMAPVNAMTDYSTLVQLIDRYNKLVGSTHPELQLDRSLVSIRDGLAHGRVSALDPADDLVLLKFERPSTSGARVAYSVTLTNDWLQSQIHRVFEELKKVMKAPGTPISGS